MPILYAQTTGTLQTNSANPTPIPGLSLALPLGVSDMVSVILNLPNPYATGSNYPGGNFFIAVNGTTLAPFACFTYGTQQPGSFNRMPTTLVVAVELLDAAQQVTALWSGVRGSTVIIDSPATLTVIV